MKCTAYNRTKIVTDLVGDDLPLCPSSGRDPSTRNNVGRVPRGGDLAPTPTNWLNGEVCTKREGTHRVANQAMPTSEPVVHLDKRCQRPVPSEPLFPLHWEKRERRSLSVTSPQSTFHGTAGSAAVGQLGFMTCNSTMPSETLKVFLYNALAEFQLTRICWVAFASDPYRSVYVQSAATPIYTTF